MDSHSELLLKGVHLDLGKVIRLAEQRGPNLFRVIYGLRTEEAERMAVASGHSTTLHSRHLPQSHEQMLACAIDFAAVHGGKLDFAKGHEAAVYTPIADQIKAAGTFLKIPVEWGGDWPHFKDWGHIQLSWEKYP